MDPLTEFASQHPQIEYVTPTSPDFNTVRSIFAHPEIIPSAILRPGSIEDVAAAVSFLARDGIEFTIRAGGHDMHGRSMKNGAVALDLRRINHVHVQVDKETATARIGGGSLMADVIAELRREGFITPVGTIGQVGYVGWAMYGGYGQYSALFGLGVDQIVGAKVVNATGEIVEAGRELLKGIRGAGGAFGVVAELTVSIYKLDKVLAGVLMFKSDDLDALVPQFNEQYRALKAQGLPKPLSLNQAVIPAPTPTFGILFLWASPDIEEGNKWVDKVAGLGPVMVNTVEEKTPKSWLDEATKIVATSTQGRLYAVSLREITDEVAQIIAHYTKNTPADPHILFDVHELRRESPSINPAPGSVFAAREPHFVVQIITIVQDKENLQKTLAWGSEFQRALQETSADNIVSASYVSFTSPEEMDPSKIYGENLPFLKNLKMKVDPGNVFKAAISYL